MDAGGWLVTSNRGATFILSGGTAPRDSARVCWGRTYLRFGRFLDARGLAPPEIDVFIFNPSGFELRRLTAHEVSSDGRPHLVVGLSSEAEAL
jgi:hypothetical protein